MLSNDKKLKVISLYQGGFTVQQINQWTGVSVSSIRKILNDAGVYKSRGVGKPKREVDYTIVELYDEGLTPLEIAQTLDITEPTVRAHLRDAGVYSKSKTGPKQKLNNRDAIINMYKSGKSVKDITQELNLSTPTVIKHLKDAGIFKDARVNRRYNNERNKNQ